jgi:hypothetical protein
VKIELVKDSTDVIEIATEYHTVLKIDDQYDVKVTFIELLTNLNDEEQMAAHITCDIEEYPSQLTLDQAAELKINIEEFVLDNIELLTKDAGKPD